MLGLNQDQKKPAGKGSINLRGSLQAECAERPSARGLPTNIFGIDWPRAVKSLM